MATTYGAAGRMAAAFIHSKLTPLFIVASMALGALAVLALPREEEPQIIVPMVDVFVEMPGATPADVEQRVTRPLEQLLWEVPGVEYVYSTSSPGQSMVVVRFTVDEPLEAALVRLNQKLAANADRIPPGVIGPIVKPRSIDDVPILAVTVWSARYADDQLRSLAVQLRDAIAEVDDVSEVTIIGGRPRQVRVDIDPARLSAYDLDPLSVQQAIARTNVRGTASGPVAGGGVTGLEAGNRLRTADELRNTVVTSARGRPVLVRDVADVVDGDAEPTSYVTFQSKASGAQPAVTIAVAKRKGTNATDVAHRVAAKLDTLKGSLVPSDVHLTVTRDYGETAADKSNELLWHMLLSVLSVSALIWLVLGRREAAVVLIAIPVTLALTLFMFYLSGYTLNRITLFALIFSIGILVDDAIVVVENIVRHARMSGEHARRACRARDSRHRRSGQPHDPRDARGGGGHPADGVHPRIVGALHAADSGGRVGGDGLLAGGRLRRDAVGRGPAAQALHASRSRRRGSPHAALSARDGAAHRQRQEARDLPGWRGGPAAGGCRARPARTRDGEDDAVRQQERVPGHRRHARGHGARDDGARRVGAGVGHAGRRDGRQRPAVRGRVGALQLQRPRAALLSAGARRTSPICR